MSQTLLDPPPPQMQRRRSRTLIVVVMVISIIISALTRDWARADREVATRGSSPVNTSGQTVSGMNSFTLALLLGGLRGPLVMMLWTSSETQKQDKDLEDFDTKVELIRLLQPEFDSVLIFQVWNKAYNISVQMSSLFNKYTTILDAIDYAQSSLRANPNNINMLEAVGDVYFNKLGSASEKVYYRDKVRHESLPHKSHQRLERNDPGWRRIELDQILDENGYLLPNLIQPKFQRPAGLPADQVFNDGSELQYLKPFQPFPYGVSPIAIAYNYYLQAQTLQRTTHARHAQLSDQVVDSRPSIALKFWAEEEQEIGRRNEEKAFNITVPAGVDRLELEMPTAAITTTQPILDQAKFNEAIANYDRSWQVAIAGRAEYASHLKVYAGNLFTYQAHIDGLNATEHFSKADAAYFRVMTTTGDERAKWIATAREEYNQTILWYERIMMKYYTDDQFITAILPGMPKERINELRPDILHQTTMQIQAAINQGAPESHAEDRNEYSTYFKRCVMRLQLLDAAAPK